MIKPDDELQRLWQGQKVAPIDTQQIEKDCRRQTLKQRFYIVVDFASLILVAIFFAASWGELTKPAAVMLILLLVLTVPFLIYMTRLRWLAASGFHSTTANFLDMLIKQMHNNARIAWLTKHSSWTTALFLVSFYGVLYILGEVPDAKVIKALIAIGVTCAVMAGTYRWAEKRERRFLDKERKLRALKRLPEEP